MEISEPASLSDIEESEIELDSPQEGINWYCHEGGLINQAQTFSKSFLKYLQNFVFCWFTNSNENYLKYIL